MDGHDPKCVTFRALPEVTIRTEDHWFVLTALIPKKTGLMAI